MNIVQKSRPVKIGRGRVDGASRETTTVSFYDGLPNFELSLDEFEELALKRLRVRTTMAWCL